MSSSLTLWVLLATLATAQGLCEGECRIAQDIVFVVDVDAVLNSHLQTVIELLQLESGDSRVALVKVGDSPQAGNCDQPEDCAQVHTGFSSDTSTLTSQMLLMSSGDAACPSCGAEVALKMLQSRSGGGIGGRSGLLPGGQVIVIITTLSNVYTGGNIDVSMLPFSTGRTSDGVTVRPPR